MTEQQQQQQQEQFKQSVFPRDKTLVTCLVCRKPGYRYLSKPKKSGHSYYYYIHYNEPPVGRVLLHGKDAGPKYKRCNRNGRIFSSIEEAFLAKNKITPSPTTITTEPTTITVPEAIPQQQPVKSTVVEEEDYKSLYEEYKSLYDKIYDYTVKSHEQIIKYHERLVIQLKRDREELGRKLETLVKKTIYDQGNGKASMSSLTTSTTTVVPTIPTKTITRKRALIIDTANHPLVTCPKCGELGNQYIKTETHTQRRHYYYKHYNAPPVGLVKLYGKEVYPKYRTHYTQIEPPPLAKSSEQQQPQQEQ